MMNSTFDAFLRSWPDEPWVWISLVVTAVVYIRGWRILHRRDTRRWHRGQPVAFGLGLTALFLALASPIEPFSALLLQVHMWQHLLLMMVAPPLLWLGAPLFPLLRGLPRSIRIYWVGPLFRAPMLRLCFGSLTHPVSALLLFTAVTWLWHAPPIYEFALRSSAWHYVQHACFIVAAMIFWYPVIRSYPSRPRWSQWLLLPCLILADLQNTILAALLTFADHVIYPYYSEVPRLGNHSALDDQAAAGVVMWVPGSIAFLIPLAWIGIQLLYGGERTGEPPKIRIQNQRISLPILEPQRIKRTHGFDLLNVPILGRFLAWRHARLAMQLPFLLGAGILIFDGLTGPAVSPMNLAGVLPWIHWRGLTILGLLAVGNVFCMACPFTLPRTLGRRWLPCGSSWPRWLRSKWLAIALLAGFLWAYEALALWDSPWWTACIAVGYFVAAFVIDAIFRGAAFCKYVCPIGQFNFVQSLVSPMEVKVRDPSVCAVCQTKDCIRGSDNIPGCELGLYLPRKAGNMDCTFCLDCIHACPHDNIGIVAGIPGKELWRDRFRSGVGRFAKRPDLAALVALLTFGAFANAAGMVGPVLEWQDRMATLLDLTPMIVTTWSYVFALLVLPALALCFAAGASRRFGRLKMTWFETATRFSVSLVPIGFGMWLAHYSFHLLASYDAILPATQRFLGDLGWFQLGDPHWTSACCGPIANWIPRLEILFLDFGLLLSLYVGYRIALTQTERMSDALNALLPWAILIVLLFAAGVWIVLQPMQMRGTMMTVG
jgi:cytochrome c oxidase assembly factor CtaG/polyferredoxin